MNFTIVILAIFLYRNPFPPTANKAWGERETLFFSLAELWLKNCTKRKSIKNRASPHIETCSLLLARLRKFVGLFCVLLETNTATRPTSQLQPHVLCKIVLRFMRKAREGERECNKWDGAKRIKNAISLPCLTNEAWRASGGYDAGVERGGELPPLSLHRLRLHAVNHERKRLSRAFECVKCLVMSRRWEDVDVSVQLGYLHTAESIENLRILLRKALLVFILSYAILNGTRTKRRRPDWISRIMQIYLLTGMPLSFFHLPAPLFESFVKYEYFFLEKSNKIRQSLLTMMFCSVTSVENG